MGGFNWKGYKQSGGYISFDEPGDKATGEILSITTGQDYKKNPCPELVLDTEDGPRTVTAGQAVLKSRLAEHEPQVGDYISIEFTGYGEAKKGQNAPKMFDVAVDRAAKDAPATAADLA